MGTCPLCRRPSPGRWCTRCQVELEPAAVAESLALPGGPPMGRAAPREARPLRRESAGGALQGARWLPADAIASWIQGTTLRGAVIDVQGPERLMPLPDPWKVGCFLLGMAALLPFGLAALLGLLIAGIFLSILGLRGGGGGAMRLIDVFFLRSLMDPGRSREPRVSYRYMVETPEGVRLVRQEGELQSGAVFRGNVVRFQGRQRGGTLFMRGGHNESLGATLSVQGSAWPLVFGVLLIFDAWLYLAILVTFGAFVLR